MQKIYNNNQLSILVHCIIFFTMLLSSKELKMRVNIIHNTKTDFLAIFADKRTALHSLHLYTYEKDLFASRLQGRFWLDRVQVYSGFILLSNGRMLSFSVSPSLLPFKSHSFCVSLFHSMNLCFTVYTCPNSSCVSISSSPALTGKTGSDKTENASWSDPLFLNNPAKYQSHSENRSQEQLQSIISFICSTIRETDRPHFGSR